MNVRMLPAHTPAFGFEALSSAKAVSALLASLLDLRFFLTFLTLRWISPRPLKTISPYLRNRETVSLDEEDDTVTGAMAEAVVGAAMGVAMGAAMGAGEGAGVGGVSGCAGAGVGAGTGTVGAASGEAGVVGAAAAGVGAVVRAGTAAAGKVGVAGSTVVVPMRRPERTASSSGVTGSTRPLL